MFKIAVGMSVLVVGLSACATLQDTVAPVEPARIGLSPLDSAQLRVASLRAALAYIKSPWTEETRLWMRRPLRRDTVTDERSRVEFTPVEWSAILEEFPNAVVAPRGQSLALCPPGRSVRMPGSGCPIRENGLIVSFGDLTLDGDGSVQTDCGIIQSKGAVTWAEGVGMRFRRNDVGGWELVEMLWRSIT